MNNECCHQHPENGSDLALQTEEQRTETDLRDVNAKLLAALEELDKVFDFSQRLDPGDFDIEDTAFADAAFAQARAAIEEAKK